MLILRRVPIVLVGILFVNLPLVSVTSAENEECSTAGNLTNEIDAYLFPEEDYKSHENKKSVLNPSRYFKMNGCTPLFIKNAEVLVIHGPKCHTVPEKIDTFDDSTITVRIKWTNIDELHNNSFKTWEGVKHLDVSNNDRLVSLSEDAFKGLSDLEKLTVNENRNLKSLHEDAFVSLRNLKELSLARNGFYKIYDMTKSIKPAAVPFVSKVDLSGNPVAYIKQHDFTTMSQLNIKSLSLKEIQPLEIGPEPFKHLKSLSDLELGSSELNPNYVDLIKSINKHQQLKVLKLHNVDMFDDTDTLITTITHYSYSSITLKDTRINTFEITETLRVESLHHIEISNSSIPNFPHTFFNGSIFPSLKRIILKNNGFKSIPKDIDRRPLNSSVEFIDLTGNRIYFLKNNSFYFAPKLQILILSDNSLHYIEDNAFADNNNLIFLDLSNNDFSKFSRKFNKYIFTNLSKLEALDLSYNKIHHFGNSDVFNYLKNLQFLSLKSNYLRKIDLKLFEPLSCLKKLDLRRNLFLALDLSIINKYLITDIGLFSTLYKVDEDFRNLLKLLATIEKDRDHLNCTKIIIVKNEKYQILNIEIKARNNTEKREPCKIVYIKFDPDLKTVTNASNIEIDTTPSPSDVTVIDDDFNYVYILFRPGYVYNSLSYKAIAIIRFLYVFTFYLLIIFILSLIGIQLVKCARSYKTKKRQTFIFDDKFDYSGIRNKGAYTISYENLKDDHTQLPKTPS